MGFVVLPLSQSSLSLERIVLLFEELVVDFDGLLVRNDAFSEKLVVSILEPNRIVRERLIGTLARKILFAFLSRSVQSLLVLIGIIELCLVENRLMFLWVPP